MRRISLIQFAHARRQSKTKSSATMRQSAATWLTILISRKRKPFGILQERKSKAEPQYLSSEVLGNVATGFPGTLREGRDCRSRGGNCRWPIVGPCPSKYRCDRTFSFGQARHRGFGSPPQRRNPHERAVLRNSPHRSMHT